MKKIKIKYLCPQKTNRFYTYYHALNFACVVDRRKLIRGCDAKFDDEDKTLGIYVCARPSRDPYSYPVGYIVISGCIVFAINFTIVRSYRA